MMSVMPGWRRCGWPLAAAAQAWRGADGNAEKGAEVFKKCRACHDVGPNAKNKVGPLLNGIFGRKAGTIEGFNYSEPTKAGDGGWCGPRT